MRLRTQPRQVGCCRWSEHLAYSLATHSMPCLLRTALSILPHIHVQVNVLLRTAGPEPHVSRLVQQLAATLCAPSVLAAGTGADAKQLLPRLEPKYTEPFSQLPLPVAVGGQLAAANGGVLLLSSASLDTKRALGLARCLAAGQAALAPGCPELCVPVTAAAWCLVAEQDLARPGSSKAAAAAPASDRIVGKYGLHFLAAFDVVVDAVDNDNLADLAADALLGAGGCRVGGFERLDEWAEIA